MLTLKPHSGTLTNIVAEMVDMLRAAEGNEEFLIFARSIIASSPYSGNDQLKTVLEYARSHIAYQPDPEGAELFTSPSRMMANIKEGLAYGDCDDFAIFCVAVCRALGYNAHIVLLDQTGGGFNHAACEVWSNETRLKIYMDPTLEDPLGVASNRLNDEPGYKFTPGYVVKLEVP